MSSNGSGKTPEPWRRPETGDTIGGHYLLRRMLGRGSFAEVWEAEDTRVPGRLVALKHIGNATDGEVAAYFRREMQILGSINDPHVVKLYDTITDHGRLWMVQELITGPGIDALLRADEGTHASSIALTPILLPGSVGMQGADAAARRIARVFLELARSLARVHAQRIMHRDIKPANIMFRDDGTAVFIDFGLARAEKSAVLQGTQLGAPGSVSWQSPEIIGGLKRNTRFDPAADVWALGLVLYQCLTRRQPFARTTEAATRDAILNEDPLPLWKLAPGVPRDLGTIALATLEKNQRRRLSDATNLADDLQRFLDGRSILSRPPSVFGKLLRFVRRQPALATLLAVIVLVPVLGAGAWLWYAPRLAAAEALELREALQRANLDGFEALFEQQHAAALESFEQALRRDATDPEAVSGKVLTLKALKRDAEAHGALKANSTALERTPLLAILAREDSQGPLIPWVRAAMEKAHTATDWFLLVQALAHESTDEARQLRSDCGHRVLLASGDPTQLHLIAAVWSAGIAGNLDAVRDADFAIRTHAPHSAEALRQAGLALAQCGATEPAMERLREAARCAPDRASVQKDLAHWMARTGEVGQALELLGFAVKKWPQHTGCQLELALQLERADKHAEALSVLEGLLKLEPDNPAAREASVRVKLLGEFSAGDIARLGNVDALIAAAIKLQQKNQAGAHLLLDRALVLAPQSARVLREKCSLLLRANDFDAARLLLPRAVDAAEKLDLKEPAARRLFNNIHSDAMAFATMRGHIDVALELGEALVRSEPRNFFFLLNCAMLRLRNLDPAGAIEALATAGKLHALDARATIWRAEAELSLGRFNECVSTVDAALALSPGDFARTDALAVQAHARALLAITPVPPGAPSLPLMGEALVAEERFAEAVPHFLPLLEDVQIPSLPGPTPLRRAAVAAVRALEGAAHADQRRFKAAAIRFVNAEMQRLGNLALRRPKEDPDAGLNELAACPVLTTLLFASSHIPPLDAETWQLEQEVLSTLRPLSRRR